MGARTRVSKAMAWCRGDSAAAPAVGAARIRDAAATQRGRKLLVESVRAWASRASSPSPEAYGRMVQALDAVAELDRTGADAPGRRALRALAVSDVMGS